MDDDRPARLRKPEERGAPGALSDDESAAGKRALLVDAPATRRGPSLVAIGVAVTAAVGAGFWVFRDTAPVRSPTPTASPSVAATPATAPAPTARSPAERLAAAFEAATGHRSAFTATVDGDEVTTAPIRIIDLPFAPALLTRSEIRDGCHACTGAIGVYYLRDDGRQMTVAARYPRAVKGWGFGAAPSDWTLTTRFTAYPAIYAQGGYTGQGVTESSAIITELRPEGPIASDLIGTGFTNSGAITEENQRSACDVEGRITDIVRDRSFSVAVSGSVSGRDRYVKRGGRFVAASRIDWSLPCG